jgi:hypothetical protein
MPISVACADTVRGRERTRVGHLLGGKLRCALYAPPVSLLPVMTLMSKRSGCALLAEMRTTTCMSHRRSSKAFSTPRPRGQFVNWQVKPYFRYRRAN